MNPDPFDVYLCIQYSTVELRLTEHYKTTGVFITVQQNIIHKARKNNEIHV